MAAANQLSDDDILAIMRIAEEREELIDQMKEALIAGKTLETLELARQVCGLAHKVAH
jgi:hypothetical protein